MKLDVKRQKGMTLIEVVVSMLIIGLGLVMCMAMLQSSLRYQVSSINQNIALQSMQSIISKIRINSKFADNYTFSSFNFNFESWLPPTNLSSECSYTDPNKMKACKQVQTDVSNWLKVVATELPRGRAEIDKITPTVNQYRIQIQWDNNSDNSRLAEAGKIAAETQPALKLSLIFSL